MKVLLVLIVFFTFSCDEKSESLNSVSIRMDKTDPDFKNITRYNLELTTWDSTTWYLVLRGYSNYLDTLSIDGDTIVTIESAQLVVDQKEDFKKLSYNKEVFELDSVRLIPKRSGESRFIYQTPKGVDTAFIKIDENLYPKLLSR